jgi:hypothetical protein
MIWVCVLAVFYTTKAMRCDDYPILHLQELAGVLLTLVEQANSPVPVVFLLVSSVISIN